MQSIAIIGMSVAACVIYGVVHDQITARICVEYFTIGHAPLFETTSPTLLGIAWGVTATWWVGVLLGLPLAVAARVGRLPKRSARSLVRPIAILMLVSAACAIAAGVAGYLLARGGSIQLGGSLAARVPQDRHVAFLVDASAHLASYAAGFVGGIVLIGAVLVDRFRMELRLKSPLAATSDPAP